MSLHYFIHEYFNGWSIGFVVTSDDCGHLKLISGETCVTVFFNLNREKHWTGAGVTVDHVEAY